MPHPEVHRATGAALASEREAHAMTRLALTSARVRCAHLEVEVLAVQETEREQLGRDLHDGVCQILASVSMRPQDYARRVAGGEGSPAENAAEAGVAASRDWVVRQLPFRTSH